MLPVESNTPRVRAVTIPAAVCVMSPAACNRTVLLAPEPVLTASVSASLPAVASVMSPVFDTTPVTALVQPSGSAATLPTVSGVTIASRNVIVCVPVLAVSCAASVLTLLPAFSRSILPTDVNTPNDPAVIAAVCVTSPAAFKRTVPAVVRAALTFSDTSEISVMSPAGATVMPVTPLNSPATAGTAPIVNVAASRNSTLPVVAVAPNVPPTLLSARHRSMFPTAVLAPRFNPVITAAAVCVMSPAACNRTVLLAAEPVLTTSVNASLPDVDSVMSPVFDTTPVTALVQPSGSAVTLPTVSGVTIASRNVIVCVPVLAVSCAASV